MVTLPKTKTVNVSIWNSKDLFLLDVHALIMGMIQTPDKSHSDTQRLRLRKAKSKLSSSSHNRTYSSEIYISSLSPLAHFSVSLLQQVTLLRCLLSLGRYPSKDSIDSRAMILFYFGFLFFMYTKWIGWIKRIKESFGEWIRAKIITLHSVPSKANIVLFLTTLALCMSGTNRCQQYKLPIPITLFWVFSCCPVSKSVAYFPQQS